MIRQHWAKTSLTVRLVVVFAVSALLLWVVLLSLVIVSALDNGKEGLEAELRTYARQILPAAIALADRPASLAKVITEVERLENQATGTDSHQDSDFEIEMRVNGNTISGPPPGTVALPVWTSGCSGFCGFGAHTAHWWYYEERDPASGIDLRLWIRVPDPMSVVFPQAAAFVLPVIVSLPLLMLPAWLMVWIGLRPLRRAAEQINERVAQGSLEPITDIVARDLLPVVSAVNALMERLRLRLQRERELVADVAHEMKTPLAIMRANLGLARTPSGTAHHAYALDDLDAGLNRADRLVQQLLRMALMDREYDGSTIIRTFDLAEFLRQRMAQVEPLASRRSIELALTAPDSLTCRQDADALAAVFDNLLDNAIKYSPEGSTVQGFVTFLPESRVQLRLLDEGPGIPAMDRERMLKRFTRLERVTVEARQSGSGLGLAIASRAVERLGGTQIDFEDGNPGLSVSVEFALFRPD